MSTRSIRTRSHLNPSRASQRGVVLLFSLIALAIMLIVAVALVRSFNNSLFTAGNIGFKRDLQNQSELAVARVLEKFQSADATTGLGTTTLRAANAPTKNYSATILTTNAEGIPDALQDSNFATVGVATNDISGGVNVTVRYVIDRLCALPGDERTSFDASSNCRLGDNPVPAGNGLDNLRNADRTITGGASSAAGGASHQSVLYRVSIRVTGPRNTQSFFQSTFTVPSS